MTRKERQRKQKRRKAGKKRGKGAKSSRGPHMKSAPPKDGSVGNPMNDRTQTPPLPHQPPPSHSPSPHPRPPLLPPTPSPQTHFLTPKPPPPASSRPSCSTTPAHTYTNNTNNKEGDLVPAIHGRRHKKGIVESSHTLVRVNPRPSTKGRACRLVLMRFPPRHLSLSPHQLAHPI